MRVQLALLALLAGGVAGATEKEGVIDPKADAALKRMSAYVGSLPSFRVDTTTVDEKVTTDGQKIQEVQQQKVMVKRPGELRVDRVSPNGHTTFVDDGKRFAAYNKEKNVYATEPAPANLDAAVDAARERLNIEAPAGDLIVSNPYDALIDGTITGHYIGLEPIDGVRAHHVALSKKDTDLQIWIKDGPDAVPLRYVITSKDMRGAPQFTVQLRDWQPNARVSKDSFTLPQPAGAKQVSFTERSKSKQEPGGQQP